MNGKRQTGGPRGGPKTPAEESPRLYALYGLVSLYYTCAWAEGSLFPSGRSAPLLHCLPSPIWSSIIPPAHTKRTGKGQESDGPCRASFCPFLLVTVGFASTGYLRLQTEEAVTMFRKRHNNHDTQENGDINQEQKVSELRSAIGPLSGRSSQYCTDACLRRYLEARNWNVDKSKKMLEESLKWRSTYRPEEIRWHEVASEGETGKVYRSNFHDREGRTVLVLRPGRQNTSSHDNQLRHLVYLIENAILNLPEGQDQMVWLIDFTGWSLGKAVPIKTARETANILQSHYPERLYAAFLYNPPRIFETFWKIVKYFLDPKTFQKVKFIYPKNEESMELMHKNFDPEILPMEFGGKNKVEYDHEEFSRLMAKDDIKSASIWGLDDKNQHVSNGHSMSDVAPEPLMIPPAS